MQLNIEDITKLLKWKTEKVQAMTVSTVVEAAYYNPGYYYQTVNVIQMSGSQICSEIY